MNRHRLKQSSCGTLARLMLACTLLWGCERAPAPEPAGQSEEGPASPTNRVDIPPAVRTNLGITFASVEKRSVENTRRMPGYFELLPTARREYRAPLPGRVELLVDQYQRVEAGSALYRIDSPVWRELNESITSAEAEVDSMPPLRAAHRTHEESLAEKVTLWEERLKQLEELRASGGGLAGEQAQARAALNETRAELADVMEKDAELEARHKQAEAALRSLRGRRDLLLAAAKPIEAHGGDWLGAGLGVSSVEGGVVESLGVTQGGMVEESALVVSLVRPEMVRFRARALQSDLGELRDGLPARVLSPDGAGWIEGRITVGLSADAERRTIDVLLTPPEISESARAWAREGVAATLEIVSEGGREELAIPLACVMRDGVTPIIFRRDPADPDRVIRMEADLGLSDGRWVVVNSGVKAGDEIVQAGAYQLMLATSGNAAKGGHFHSDGTFHEGEH